MLLLLLKIMVQVDLFFYFYCFTFTCFSSRGFIRLSLLSTIFRKQHSQYINKNKADIHVYIVNKVQYCIQIFSLRLLLDIDVIYLLVSTEDSRL
jgi:hypothetical protein